MNKVVFVQAFFKPVGKEKTVKVPTGETKKGFLGGEKKVYQKETQWVQTGWSDSWIDGVRLSNDVAAAVSELNNQGYEVVSITPVTSGNYNFNYNVQGVSGAGGGGGGWGYGYGYGYSYTEGVIIVGQKDVGSDDVSFEKGLKKCPSCAETIKLEVLKCRYCGHAFDPAEIKQQLEDHRVKLAELEELRRLEREKLRLEREKLEREKREREKLEQEMEQAGLRQCPECGKWEMRIGAVIENGSFGDWCPNCEKSLQKMRGEI